jgi:hypothetical protein
VLRGGLFPLAMDIFSVKQAAAGTGAVSLSRVSAGMTLRRTAAFEAFRFVSKTGSASPLFLNAALDS